jgi:hypothetical protein
MCQAFSSEKRTNAISGGTCITRLIWAECWYEAPQEINHSIAAALNPSEIRGASVFQLGFLGISGIGPG